MARLLLGRHPQGAYGLFISKPGVAVESVAPGDPNLFFSTAWGDVINIIAAGTMNVNDTVTLPSVGFRPFIRVEENLNGTYATLSNFGVLVNVATGINRRYDYTRFNPVYISDTQFKVQKRDSNLDQQASPQSLRYVAFSFPYNQ